MKKLFFLIAFIAGAYTSFAQITTATLTASGLTCSMCSRAIYKSLVKMPTVASVAEDIEHSAFTITFKPGNSSTPDQIRKAVTDAGFAIASLKLTATFHNDPVAPDAHLQIDGNTYHFLDVPQRQLQGQQTITIVDKNFVSQSEFRKYSKLTKMKCYATGMSESCCPDGTKKDSRIYHVTL